MNAGRAAPADVTRFDDVDHGGDADFFERFLTEAGRLESLRRAKTLTIDALALRPGVRALDVGCGLGDDAAELARRVTPGGWAVGLDYSQAMLQRAHRRHAGLEGLELVHGDAAALPFPDGVFGAVRAERLLVHSLDPDRVLAEMVRVTRPGGRVAVYDVDCSNFFAAPARQDVTQAVGRALTAGVRHGTIGASLPQRLRDAGLSDVRATPIVQNAHWEFFELLVGGSLKQAREAGWVTAADARAWWQDLRAAAHAGRFSGGHMGMAAVGTRPA